MARLLTLNSERIAAIYATCFIIGAASHGRDFLVHGLRPYAVAPIPIEVFWSSLLVIDLAIAYVLLLQSQQWGAVCALVVMMVDVSVNTYAVIILGLGMLVGPLVLQSIFLGFIVGTIPKLFALRERRSASRSN